MNIYENGIKLNGWEKKRLHDNSETLNDKIYWLMKRFRSGFTTQELYATLQRVDKHVNYDSVRRGTTQQTDCHSGKNQYRDQFGRYRLIKTDEKRLNPESDVMVSVYKANPEYGTDTPVTKDNQLGLAV